MIATQTSMISQKISVSRVDVLFMRRLLLVVVAEDVSALQLAEGVKQFVHLGRGCACLEEADCLKLGHPLIGCEFLYVCFEFDFVYHCGASCGVVLLSSSMLYIVVC
jgi:hypothetical protein